MRDKTILQVVIGLCCVVAIGAGVIACKPQVLESGNMAFQCFDDDTMVENHFGVTYAYRDGDMWYLEYRGGHPPVWYKQDAGENCGTAPAADD